MITKPVHAVLYGLYFVPAPANENVQHFLGASHDIEKLTNFCPHTDSWTVGGDPHDRTLKRYSELADNSKYLIREIPYII